MILTWPTIVLWMQGVFSLPLYILILLTIVIKSKSVSLYRSPFYMLTLSQGIADILAMISFFLVISLKNTRLFDDFYWANTNSYWVAAWSYNNVYFFLFLRCFGIMLISVQRYVTICLHLSKVNQLMRKIPPLAFVAFHWIPPTIISLPVILNTNIHFDRIETLNVIVQPERLTTAAFLANCFLFVTFSVCMAAYCAVLRMIWSNKHQISSNMKREVRLFIQMAGLVMAFVVIFIYYVIQFTAGIEENRQLIYTMRFLYPVLTGILSFTSPWLCFILNGDLRNEIIKLYVCNGQSQHNTSRVFTSTRQ